MGIFVASVLLVCAVYMLSVTPDELAIDCCFV